LGVGRLQMPETKNCPLGIENKTRIDGMEKAVDEIKEAVTNLSNHYSQRPTWFISIVISSLVALCVFLAQYIITRGV